MTLTAMPKENEVNNLNLLIIFKPKNIPNTVENSARLFIKEATKSPLRESIAIKATADVNTAGTKPKSSKDKTMGIPVKSNFKIGNHGKGIFSPEYFNV